MQQELPKTAEEAMTTLHTLVEAMKESLLSGTASKTLEHDTIVDLAYELGSTSAIVSMAARGIGPKSLEGFNALIVAWRDRYNAIHGED